MRNNRKYFGLLFALVFSSANSFASPAILKAFIAHFPDAEKNQLNSCLTCHSGLKAGFINGYAVDLKNAKYDFDAIADLDSDGDGVTNGEEIKAGTLPGSQSADPEIFIFTPKTMPRITFMHGDHQMDPKYGISGNCLACHDSTNTNHFQKLFDNTVSVKDKAHATCLGCHKTANNPNAPTSCLKCHVKPAP